MGHSYNGILHSSKKKNELWLHTTIWINTICVKETRHKRVYAVWFHLYEQAKIIEDSVSQKSGDLEEVHTGKVQEGAFWCVGNGACLDVDGGLAGVYTYKSSSSCTLRIVHCYKDAVSQLKSREGKFHTTYLRAL
jgi:hypothetical protein